MKRFLTVLICVIMCMFPVTAFAEEANNDAGDNPSVNISQPKIIVSSYSVEGNDITPKRNSKIKVVLTNTSKTTDICNMKLVFSCSDGAVLSSGTDSVYVEKLLHGANYEWVFAVTASSSAETGKHTASVTAEYETADGGAFTSADNMTLNVYNPPSETESEETEIRTQPKLMISDYEIENGFVTPDSSTVIKVTVVNTNKTYLVRNIKMSFVDESGEIVSDKMSSIYVNKISSGGSYVWEIPVTAVKTAVIGEHNMTVSIDYEDTAGGSYNVSEILRIPVRQTAQLDFDGAELPVKVVQGDTVTVSVNLMNTGKSILYNCKMKCDIDSLSSGGTAFVGQIDPGTNKACTANLQVSSDKEGEVKGKITISYEDAFGEVTEQTVDVSTLIEKRVEISDVDETEKEEKKNPLWWLFIVIGLLVGGGLGFGIPFAIREKKQRLEDEEKL